MNKLAIISLLCSVQGLKLEEPKAKRLDTTLIKFVEEEETSLDYDPSDVQIRFVDIDDLKWNDELAEFHKIENYG